MLDRNAMSTGDLGYYSELLVAAMYTAEGYQVAFGRGSQKDWDLVVRKGNEPWKTVQVKTVNLTGACTSISLRRSSLGKSYTADDVDEIVAVYPETGTMWRIGPDIFAGLLRLTLTDDFLWKGAVVRGKEPTPLMAMSAGVDNETKRATRERDRLPLAQQIPQQRPEWISEDTWAMVQAWLSGRGYKSIASASGIHPGSVRTRIIRVLYRFGLKDMPKSLANPRREYRKRLARKRRHQQAVQNRALPLFDEPKSE